jgi:hypothetical protein
MLPKGRQRALKRASIACQIAVKPYQIAVKTKKNGNNPKGADPDTSSNTL